MNTSTVVTQAATLDDLLVRYGDARVAAAKAASDPEAVPHLAEAGRLRAAHRTSVRAVVDGGGQR